MRQTILLLAAAAAATASLASAQDCDTFKCHHNSKCKQGSADFAPLTDAAARSFAILTETVRDNHHCKCNDGFTGLQCDVKYEICDPASNPDFACFHGSTCVKRKDADKVTGTKDEWTCDCTTAEKAGNKIFVAGDNCEVVASAVCDASDDGLDSEHWFCTNGGACRDNNGDVEQKCDCTSDFKGDKCQFPKGKVQPECDLTCKHGGQCAFGAKEHGKAQLEVEMYFTENKFIDGMHCVCPEGYAGVQCEAKLEKCGNKYCYHGAQCLKEEDDFGNATHFCDCSTATDLENASGGWKQGYAGRFCEHKATTMCTAPDGKEAICTNGGKCAEQHHMGCDCPKGFTGPACQYKEEKEPKCKLNCKHGGQCRKGIKQSEGGLSAKFDLAAGEGHINFEHCSCPEGFYGIDCSVKIKKCGDGEHVCGNGGQCVATGTNKDGKVRWGCDCMGETVAGTHCEHDATQLCIISGNPDDAGHSFCTNGGECVQMIKNAKNQHVGCDCPAGYEGKKCQYKSGQEGVVVKEVSTPKSSQALYSGSTSVPAGSSSSGGKSGMSAGGKFIVAALVVGLVAAAFVFVRRKMVLRKSGREEQQAHQEQSAGANHMITEDIGTYDTNEDGGEQMTTVEVI